MDLETHLNLKEPLEIKEQKIPLVVDPKSGDIHRAQDILDEVQAVLKKYGYALAHRPHAIILAKLDGGVARAHARVIADVRQITPYMIEYREVDWSKVSNG